MFFACSLQQRSIRRPCARPQAPRIAYFRRDMRRYHRLLMDGDEPVGGPWNYDAGNRGGSVPMARDLHHRPLDSNPTR
jgi:deoxyribodipyrimidine photolyase-like uncharacterized protein